MRSRIAASVVDLPLPVGPGDEDQAARHRVERRRPTAGRFRSSTVGIARRDQAEDRGRAALLPQQVDAEARLLAHLVGEVDVARSR